MNNGFRAKYSLFGGVMPNVQHIVIGNGTSTVTLTVGDVVKITPHASTTTGGGLDPADNVADFIYGYLEGFVVGTGTTRVSGLPLDLAGTGAYDGTLTLDPSGDTYVSATDNLTDKKIAGVVRPAFGVVVSAKLDAAMGSVTAGSNKVGMYFDILTTDSRKLDETSATTTKAQFISMPGRSASDPTDPTDPITTRILAVATQSLIAQG